MLWISHVFCCAMAQNEAPHSWWLKRLFASYLNTPAKSAGFARARFVLEVSRPIAAKAEKEQKQKWLRRMGKINKPMVTVRWRAKMSSAEKANKIKLFLEPDEAQEMILFNLHRCVEPDHCHRVMGRNSVVMTLNSLIVLFGTYAPFESNCWLKQLWIFCGDKRSVRAWRNHQTAPADLSKKWEKQGQRLWAACYDLWISNSRSSELADPLTKLSHLNSIEPRSCFAERYESYIYQHKSWIDWSWWWSSYLKIISS